MRCESMFGEPQSFCSGGPNFRPSATPEIALGIRLPEILDRAYKTNKTRARAKEGHVTIAGGSANQSRLA